MTTLLLAVAPLYVLWGLAHGYVWLRIPSSRGARRQRRADRRKPDADPAATYVDLSRDAAARVFAFRVGSLVRGVAYFAVLIAVLSHLALIAVPFVIAFALWVHNRWGFAANLAYVSRMGKASLVFAMGARVYLFPSHRRSVFSNLWPTWGPIAVSVFGTTWLLGAGLSLAYHSDAIATGIPHVYVQHSGLAWWQIGSTAAGIGGLLCWLGMSLERRARRAAMRRETSLDAPAPDEEVVVFLRPFDSSALRVVAHCGPRQEGLTVLVPRVREYLEDVATWLLWCRGQVVAIGDPAQRQVPTVGAAHHHLTPDADWRMAVKELLSRACAILLIPGVSEGAAWETQEILRTPELARRALMINPRPEEDPLAFLRMAGMEDADVGAGPPLGLRVIGVMHGTDGPQALCSSLVQDVDIEAAVEWFIWSVVPPMDDALRYLAKTAG